MRYENTYNAKICLQYKPCIYETSWILFRIISQKSLKVASSTTSIHIIINCNLNKIAQQSNSQSNIIKVPCFSLYISMFHPRNSLITIYIHLINGQVVTSIRYNICFSAFSINVFDERDPRGKDFDKMLPEKTFVLLIMNPIKICSRYG